MVTVTRKARFSAGHRYYLEDRSPEENRAMFGACARPHGHGHDYVLEVSVAGVVEPTSGMVLNIVDLKRILEEEVVGPLDGEFLTGEHPYMGGMIPGTEALACRIWQRLLPRVAQHRARLKTVRLGECRSLWAECRRGKENPEEKPMVTLTRSYEFAAAHRLHNPNLSDGENREVFGKCNNPQGHGHNYVLEVTVGGEPDPQTGFVIDLGLLDRTVHELVVDRYDHRHLNEDVPEFREVNPTSENLVRIIWERLLPALPSGSLRRVTVRETERNVFSCEGEDE